MNKSTITLGGYNELFDNVGELNENVRIDLNLLKNLGEKQETTTEGSFQKKKTIKFVINSSNPISAKSILSSLCFCILFLIGQQLQ